MVRIVGAQDLPTEPDGIDPWEVTTRINKAGNLTIEVALNGIRHAAVVLQENGVIDFDTTARRGNLPKEGWTMRSAASPAWRKYRFKPDAD